MMNINFLTTKADIQVCMYFVILQMTTCNDHFYLPPGGSPEREIMKCSLCVRACVGGCVRACVRASVSVSRRLL